MSEHAGHRNRLRLRFKKEGLNGFAPHEVLELLLTYAIPRVDTNPIAHALIHRFGSLHGVLEAMNQKLEELKALSGTEQAARYQKETEGCITAVSRLQRAVTDLGGALAQAARQAEEN